MKKVILLILALVGVSGCSHKDPHCKVLCEEQNCVEEVTIEAKRHSRW